jgi:hypothetical protein
MRKRICALGLLGVVTALLPSFASAQTYGWYASRPHWHSDPVAYQHWRDQQYRHWQYEQWLHSRANGYNRHHHHNRHEHDRWYHD